MWKFDPIPRTSEHPAADRWALGQAQQTGGANVWSLMTVDAERDLVFLPTASATPDHWGGARHGTNEFANSVVALRVTTGDVVWSFQVVHHDLWDYDVAAQPVMVDIQRASKLVPALIVGTKTGMLFVLDRETGRPLSPVLELPVPKSDIETAWPTQPFTRPSLRLHSTLLTVDSMFGITPEERAECRDRFEALAHAGMFTPPSIKGSLVWPGVWGGTNWDGMAWDQERGILIVPIKRLGMVVQLHAGSKRPPSTTSTEQYFPPWHAPFGVTRSPFVSSEGTPCTPPPWSELVAVDLQAESVLWRKPLGKVPWLLHLPEAQQWGSLTFGGPLITASGLVFIAAGQDDRIRAFDIHNGELLWEHELPAGGQAAPMTFVKDGRQFVILSAGGRAGVGSPGDWIVAFALPQR